MDDLYRDYILEHYRRPHNFGVIEDADASYEGANPLCGDRITLMLGVKDGVVDRVGFTGRGCAISQASASLLTDEIKGKPLAEVAAIRADDLLDLLGIEISPARLKCAMLSHDSLQHVLGDLGAATPAHRARGRRMTARTTGSSAAAGVCRRPDAGRPRRGSRPRDRSLHRPGAIRPPARRTPEPIHPCRSPTPTSFARPAPRSEKSPRRRSTPSPRAPPRSSTSARRPSGSRATCPAPATSPRATSSSRSRASPPIATRPSILYCAGGVRSLFAAQTLAEMGYTDVASMSGGFQAWKGAGLDFETPVVLTAEQKQRYSRHLLIPEVGSDGQAQAARLEGAAHRRRRPRLAGRAVPRRGRRRDDRHRRLRRRRRQQPPAPDRPHDRSGRGAQGRVARGSSINALNPEVNVVAHEEMLVAGNVERIIAGYDVILDGTDTFETRYILNDAAVAAGIPVVHASVFRFEGQLTTFVPYEGPCYRCLYPTPPPPELAPGCSVAGVLGVVPGILGLLQTNEALKVLLGIGNTLAGRLLLFDALETEFTELKLRRDPNCPVCSDAAVEARAERPSRCRSTASTSRRRSC